MKLLSIDPGTYYTGLYDGERPWTWEIPKDLTRAERFADILQRLTMTLQTAMNKGDPFDFVAYELAFVRGRDASRCGFGLDGIIEAAALLNKSGVVDVNNRTLKKWAGVPVGVGSRGLTKLEKNKVPMITKAEELTGWKWTNLNEHEADAIILWYYVKDTLVRTGKV